MTELPQEIQIKYLLPLSYEEITNYCQTSKEALKICESETFWKMKLKYHRVDPRYLDFIIGPTPSIRYKDLVYILNDPRAPNVAVILGQTNFLGDMIAPRNFRAIEANSLFRALRNGHFEMAESLWKQPAINQEAKLNLFANAMAAFLEYSPELALGLYDRIDLPSDKLLVGVLNISEKPSSYKLAFDKVLSRGDQEALQQFIDEVIPEIDSETEKAEWYDFIAENYPQYIDVKRLFFYYLGDCPVAEALFKYLKNDC